MADLHAAKRGPESLDWSDDHTENDDSLSNADIATTESFSVVLKRANHATTSNTGNKRPKPNTHAGTWSSLIETVTHSPMTILNDHHVADRE